MGGMRLSIYLKAERGRTQHIAELLGVSPSLVSQWAAGKKAIPPERGAELERATNGDVPRWDQRPHDWWRIWPELVGSPGAPSLGQLEAAGPASAGASHVLQPHLDAQPSGPAPLVDDHVHAPGAGAAEIHDLADARNGSAHGQGVRRAPALGQEGLVVVGDAQAHLHDEAVAGRAAAAHGDSASERRGSERRELSTAPHEGAVWLAVAPHGERREGADRRREGRAR
jgi:DNA-binding transcriptional regulator YdaS (Cro superfamily)